MLCHKRRNPTKQHMPSQTISFSNDGYVKIAEEKPDDTNFSAWVEEMCIEGIEQRNEQSESDNSGQTETQ